MVKDSFYETIDKEYLTLPNLLDYEFSRDTNTEREMFIRKSKDLSKPSQIEASLTSVAWGVNKILHRDNDLPATVSSIEVGSKTMIALSWFSYNISHRTNGPAYTVGETYEEALVSNEGGYFLFGQKLTPSKYNRILEKAKKYSLPVEVSLVLHQEANVTEENFESFAGLDVPLEWFIRGLGTKTTHISQIFDFWFSYKTKFENKIQ